MEGSRKPRGADKAERAGPAPPVVSIVGPTGSVDVVGARVDARFAGVQREEGGRLQVLLQELHGPVAEQVVGAGGVEAVDFIVVVAIDRRVVAPHLQVNGVNVARPDR